MQEGGNVMMEEIIRDIERALLESGEGKFRPASAEKLKQAIEFGIPDELIDFYRNYEPAPEIGCVELHQRIWNIDNVILENTDAVPGCSLFPHGYIVFASNLFGDAYCMDKNVQTDGHHPIVLFPHDAINEETTIEEFIPYRLQVADSLQEFLKKFAEGTLEDEPFYG